MMSSVVSRVAGLGALTAAGQLVVIGSLPTYSKAFEPGPYRETLIFVGAFTVISVLAGLRYDSALVLPRSETLAAALFGLVMLIAGTVAAAIAAVTLGTSLLQLTPPQWGPIVRPFGYGLAVATAVGA